MKRTAVLLATLLMALTAPVQVWCQATCAQPSHATMAAVAPHCPLHSQSSGRVASNAHEDQCRAPESSRSASPVRTFVLGISQGLLAQGWTVAGAGSVAAPWLPVAFSLPTPAFHHTTPLRI